MMAQFYTADEAFTTGTMGGITPICEIDARLIGYSTGNVGMDRFPIISRIQEAYKALTETNGFVLPAY